MFPFTKTDSLNPLRTRRKKFFTLIGLLTISAFAFSFTKEIRADEANAPRLFADLDYAPEETYPDGRELLDIYAPKQVRSAPVVVFFHGGGLMKGDKSLAEKLAQNLAREGVLVVTPNYRLAPDHPYPVPVEDAARAVAYVVRHIDRYGGDPGRIYLAGHSAGGYLAALLAVNEEFLIARSVSPSEIKGAATISPFLYIEETAKDRDKSIWGKDPKAWLKASVSPYITKGKPPFLSLYAEGDAPWRKSQNTRYVKALKAVGNEARAVEIKNRDHQTVMTNIAESDDPVIREMVKFITQQAAKAE